jgi:hypothetical protein
MWLKNHEGRRLMRPNNRKTEQKKKVELTRLTHEGKVDVQATLVVNEWGIADAVKLDPITDILTKLEVARLCAIELI